MSDRPCLPASSRRRFLSSSLFGAAVALFLVAGCGGGGEGGGGGPPAVAIQTTSLPSGGLGVPYSVALTASGGGAPYTWTLNAGSTLPPGISLLPGGLLTGAPTQLGSFGFTVVVTDAAATTASAAYSLVVASFDASIALLRFGEAWTGEGYPLSATGGAGATFTLLVNASGGAITNANPSASTARYVAGAATGTDRIRATSPGGAVEDFDVVVQPNPVATMTARFSSTDVWFLRFEGKFDASHSYASDYDKSLVTVGLRAPGSTGPTGSTADELAKLLVRRQTLRWLNTFYRNNADGTPASGGLGISFPFDEPDDPHVAPAPGAIVAPAWNQYNVMAMVAGDTSGVIGTAWLDETTNDSQENDTPSSQGGTLGVFVDEISSFFNGPYGNNVLPATPVGSGDVAALKALLYGTASPGGRYNELQRIADGLGRTFAAVAAHEIGHSLGLEHTSPTVSGSIMNPSSQISPVASYSFTSGALATLSGGLPGPGRGGSPQYIAGFARFASPGEGEVGFANVVCGCRVHRRTK